MPRFGTLVQPPHPPRANKPFSLGATATPAWTAEGGRGFTADDPRTELFNAAVSGLLADGFYESGDARVARIRDLSHQVALEDPAWVQGFVPWLRDTAGLRSAPIVVAAAYAAVGAINSRAVVASALKRADEPGEFLAYYRHTYGRRVPSRVKRGVADAVQRLYNERSTSKWDGQSKGYRFGDVLEVVHAKPRDEAQSVLFKYLLDRRRHPAEPIPETLTGLRELQSYLALELQHRHFGELPSLLTWEALAASTPGGITAQGWSALLENGNLGLMALMRNLNNIDRAGVKAPDLVSAIKTQLADPAAITRAKLLPYRFLTAYRASETDRWREALEAGAEEAMTNLPMFPGVTVLMVDCSGSMQSPVGGGKSSNPLSRSVLAGFLAESLGRRCENSLIVSYGTQINSVHEPKHHVGVLKAASGPEYRPNGGTNTWACTSNTFSELKRQGVHVSRIIILTDEQTMGFDDGSINVPIITWNLAGDRVHQARHGTPNRFLVSGYSDTALQTLPDVIVHGSTGAWPWESGVGQ